MLLALALPPAFTCDCAQAPLEPCGNGWGIEERNVIGAALRNGAIRADTAVGLDAVTEHLFASLEDGLDSVRRHRGIACDGPWAAHMLEPFSFKAIEKAFPLASHAGSMLIQPRQAPSTLVG